MFKMGESEDVISDLDKSKWQLVFQGAESRVYRGEYNSSPAILKERFVKTYRVPELDQKLTKERIRSELKAYVKLSKKCPMLAEVMSSVLFSDDRNIIFTEITDSYNLSEFIKDIQKSNSSAVDKVMEQLGKIVAQIHQCGLVHGDLTTSNFLVKKSLKSDTSQDMANQIIPIDFGLSSSSTSDEDRAVDLYVLERAIESTHQNVDFNVLLKSYAKEMGTDKTIKKLNAVRSRGRKRSAIG